VFLFLWKGLVQEPYTHEEASHDYTRERKGVPRHILRAAFMKSSSST
jgi:hypothetical protein